MQKIRKKFTSNLIWLITGNSETTELARFI